MHSLFIEWCICESGLHSETCDLVRICGSYLCPASLPKEPMVRRGLTQVGSGVFWTSVLTSGSISEGEGVSLAPAMALSLCLSECYLQQRAANMFPPPGSRIGSVSDRRRGETASPVLLVVHEGGGTASPSLLHHRVLRHTEGSISLSPGYRALLHPWWKMWCPPCVSETRRHDVTSTARSTLRAPHRVT